MSMEYGQSLFPIANSQQLVKRDDFALQSFSSFQVKDEDDTSEEENQKLEITSSKKRKHERDKQLKKLKKHKHDKKAKKKKKEKTEKEIILELEKKNLERRLHNRRPTTSHWLDGALANIEADEITVKQLYFYDTSGDQDNLLYSSLHRTDVPMYYKKLYCIGLRKSEGITWSKNSGQYVVYKMSNKDQKSNKKKRYHGPIAVAQQADVDQKRYVKFLGFFFDTRRRLKLGELKKKVEGPEDFVPLELEKKVPAGDDSDSDFLDRDFLPPEEGETFEDHILRKTREYNQLTRENPHDIALWLQFIAFQDELLKSSNRKNTKKGVIEKKIAIYEKALLDNPGNEELLLGVLREASLLYDSERLLDLWKKIIHQHSKKPRMWEHYIDFVQTNFNAFTVTSMREIYCSAIQTLQNMAMDTSISQGDIKQLETSLLDIFVKGCMFEKQAGYMERAVALFQALIEFNCFCPKNLYRYSTQMQRFRDFWDAEAPRFGDQGSVGWLNWTSNEDAMSTTTHEQEDKLREQKQSRKQKKHRETEEGEEEDLLPSVFPLPPPQQNEEEAEEKKMFSTWLEEEEKREEEQWQPCRPLVGFGVTGENEEVDDPERVVFFEDIQDYIFQFTCEDLKLELYFRFLEFLGVQLPARESSTGAYYQQRLQYMESLNDLFEMLVKKQVPWEIEKKNLDNTRVTFVRNTFTLMLQVFNDLRISLAYLSFESLYNMSGAKKLAKSLLQTRRDDLELWNGYAQINYKYGSKDEAKKVYIASLSSNPNQETCYLLYAHYAQMELELGHTQAALSILACVPEKKPPVLASESEGPAKTTIVKARKQYQQAFSNLKYSSSTRHFVVCFALFQYLSVGVDQMCEVFEEGLRLFKEGELDHEELLISYVKSISKHASAHPLPPGKMRDILMNAMRVYPTNPLFLSLFIEGEARSQIANRVRSYFDEACTKYQVPILWLFAVYTETTKLGAANRIRTLFEKALEHPRNRHCIVLWRFYMKIELDNGNIEMVKGMFYRAIRDTPWAKDLWMDSMRNLRQYLTVNELHDILKLMTDKEIRIRRLPEIE